MKYETQNTIEDSLIAAARALIDLLRASQMSVAADYHLGVAIRRIEGAIVAIEDLKNETWRAVR